MDLKEMGWQYVEWIHLTQDRNQNVKTVMKLEESVKGGEFLD
jgi:hypothetical protein